MEFILLALMSLRSAEVEARYFNKAIGFVLVAGAEIGMTPDQLADFAYPDRGMQRPDPAGSMLYFWYDKCDVQIVWEVRSNLAGGGPQWVLRSAGKQ